MTVSLDATTADAGALVPAADRALVIVLRDAHRHPWIRDFVPLVALKRPDAIVVGDGSADLVPTPAGADQLLRLGPSERGRGRGAVARRRARADALTE